VYGTVQPCMWQWQRLGTSLLLSSDTENFLFIAFFHAQSIFNTVSLRNMRHYCPTSFSLAAWGQLYDVILVLSPQSRVFGIIETVMSELEARYAAELATSSRSGYGGLNRTFWL
jgi:hypothetical protein